MNIYIYVSIHVCVYVYIYTVDAINGPVALTWAILGQVVDLDILEAISLGKFLWNLLF